MSINLETALSNLNENYADVTALIPNLYYFWDDTEEGDENEIDDGGDDMYDGANCISTDLIECLSYTHTQAEEIPSTEDDDDPQYTSPPMDGIVVDGADEFGSGSSYFTNMYPGMFVLGATNCSITMFAISGNNGADGDGEVTGYEFSTSIAGNQYRVFVKTVGETNDPSINHIIICNNNEDLEHTWETEDTNNDFDQVAGPITELFYLVVASRVGSGEDANGDMLLEADALAITDEFLRVIYNQEMVLVPQYTFEVIAYDLSDILSQSLPDTYENTIAALNERTVFIEKVGNFKHGEQFYREGQIAYYLKKLYVDVDAPSLKIV